MDEGVYLGWIAWDKLVSASGTWVGYSGAGSLLFCFWMGLFHDHGIS